jgi:hypothetical protein
MPSIIKSSVVRAVGPGAQAATGRPGGSRGGARSCDKSVELLREGGVVHALQITCSCGDKTVVELEYPAEPNDEAAQ